MGAPLHPSLYQINTRVQVIELSQALDRRATLVCHLASKEEKLEFVGKALFIAVFIITGVLIAPVASRGRT